MDKDNGITFIITVYNKEKFLKNTLNSVLENLVTNSEVIIVDDGSTDNSKKIIKSFIKKFKVPVKFIKQENSGPSKAINNALKFVNYSHIKMVDGDDILAPKISQFMKEEMQKSKLDLLYGNWVWADNYSKYNFDKEIHDVKIFKNAFEKFLISGWGGCSNSMMTYKALFDVGGCDEESFIQDYSIPLRIAGYHFKGKELAPKKIGITKKIICVGPKFQEKRIMGNDAQTLHDLSIVAVNYLQRHPYVCRKLKRKCLKKINGRLWKWEKRKNNLSLFSQKNYDFIKSYLFTDQNLKKLKFKILNAWKGNSNIRILTNNDNCNNILIYVGLDLLGDGIIKVPFLRNIRKNFPNSNITWLAGKGNSVMNGSLKPITFNLIDRIIENAHIGEDWKELFKKPKIDKKYDIIIDTQKRFLTTLILKKLKHEIFISPSCKYYFSDLVPCNKKEPNLIKELLNLSLLFDKNEKEKITDLPLNRKLRASDKNYLKKFKNDKVAICPGASNNFKRWPLERFILVGKYLLSKNISPIFFLGPNEIDFYKDLKVVLPAAGFPIQENKNINYSPDFTMLFAKYCKLGISNDTGCGHLLANAGLPIISLFGPTNYKKFSTLDPTNQNINLSSKVLSNTNNIEDIPVDAVIHSINKILFRKIKNSKKSQRLV
ncbi:MAG: hypothetical protein CMM91_00830 [Rickettsiales bacterium]|nr:hypothetical protein [Rickettsiales bacterium]OUV54761.1 MAG: hypothetical protein CBC87_00270 [Rickettsiales bacterium TMED127]|tara:strand:- start:24494 stop:26467 length:1974 start_codon:yes stop_codon:yes gene_type:complete